MVKFTLKLNQVILQDLENLVLWLDVYEKFFLWVDFKISNLVDVFEYASLASFVKYEYK